ncbi:LysR family transcriptional regulator [Methylobacterium nonmethylotrophicum]|uniref:LysR family transcriptional regulator n=1 Tax=Methylobacterium nonmethylotrophicum TaxID=1141884 RepID=A0A4Z0NQJ4_9HYPH|nr:LysR family transcriptional regulator [Methylobacterium nonmethylotrophicum]TGD99302.1 LysR family transcriptional regulator [Methylobacterium nonmethylotrophicum]
MDRDLWSGLAVFAAIVEAGSFARAAVRLGLSASALSHAMRTLEDKLGTRLIDRTTRSLAPTQAGAELLLSLRPALDSVEGALETLASSRARPAGRVRVNAHRTAAVHAVLPRLAGFAAAYPDIAVELVVDDGLVDIVAERFDCGVRHEGELQRDMISVRISDPVPLVFVAAPAYLAGIAPPQGPDDLGRHRCLCYRYTSSGTIHVWDFSGGGRRFERTVPGAFVTNDVDLMRDAALAGLGIASLPQPCVEAQIATGALVEVLAGWAPVLPPNHLYYPSRRQPSAAFRAFVEALRI